ncbi:calmodulin-like isoform X2 [Haliotis rubra]|uniref:calmodulin-like isoform X2 n=1 Tax=Haliotis rubra TaxID=36100 RepID=UPI001EE5B7D9|nr:calmodulin-like isoform X2 [Haliotis rubra]
MSHLTQAERESYTKFFLGVDSNGDGYLNKTEFKCLCEKLGFRLKPSKLKEMFHGVDTDNNDKITLDEFLATMPGISTVERKCANLRQVFIAADINEDGVLSCQELREAVRSVGSALQPSDIDTLLARLDKDGEGKLSYEQFLEHFSKQKKV